MTVCTAHAQTQFRIASDCIEIEKTEFLFTTNEKKSEREREREENKKKKKRIV